MDLVDKVIRDLRKTASQVPVKGGRGSVVDRIHSVLAVALGELAQAQYESEHGLLRPVEH